MAAKKRLRGGRKERHTGRRAEGQGSAGSKATPLFRDEALEAMSAWIPSVIYGLVTVVLFREFIFSDLMLVGQDTFSLGYAARAFFADALRTTGFPLWNPQILGGTPFLESLAGGDSLYPPSLVLLLLTETYRALGWKLVLHVFLAGCFTYLWVRVIGGSKGGAFLAGLAYMLGPYLVSLVYPGHDGKLFVTALTPLLFSASEWMMSRRDLLPSCAVAAVVALVILTTHFQMAYFLFGSVGAYVLVRCIQLARAGRGWRYGARKFAVFLCFSTIGAAAAGIQLVPAVVYVTEFSRRTMTTVASGEQEDAVAYSASWSLHPEEAVALVVPEFVGNNSGGADWATNTYWGRNPFKTNHEYLGVVALLLAALAFGRPPGRRDPEGRGSGGGGGADVVSPSPRWFFAGLGGLALLFALGANTPVWRIFYELLPGISLFRASSMAIFLTGFSVATLAAMGFDRGLRLISHSEVRRVLLIFLFPTAAICLGWLLAQVGAFQGLWTTLSPASLTEVRAASLEAALPFIARGFGLATLLGVLVAGVWWGLARGLPTALAVGLLALLITFDEGRIDAAFIQTVDFDAFTAADDNDRLLMERAENEDPFRVLSLVRNGQDVDPGMHGLELAGGHHPNDLAHYRELIGMAGSGLPIYLVPPFHANVMGILNVRYILWPDTDYGSLDQWVPEVLMPPLQRLQLQNGSPFRTVYAYPGLPRARLIGEAVVVPEARSLETVLSTQDFDPTTQVVLTEAPPVELAGPDIEGSVSWVVREPNRLVLDVVASGSALLVLAENWFPAWKAHVGEDEVPVLRANHALRAVPVPGGSHRVELTYESDLLRASLGLSVIATLLLAGVAGTSLARRRRRGDVHPDFGAIE